MSDPGAGSAGPSGIFLPEHSKSVAPQWIHFRFIKQTGRPSGLPLNASSGLGFMRFDRLTVGEAGCGKSPVGWMVRAARDWLPEVPPLVAVAVAVAAGCWLGTAVASWTVFTGWYVGGLIGVAVVLVVASLVVGQRRSLPQPLLPWGLTLAGIVLAVAGWGWCRVRLFPAEDFAWNISETPQPVVVEGIVLRAPRLRPSPSESSRADPARMHCQWQIRLTAARHHERWEPVAGRAWVFVDGPCWQLLPGSRVRLFGRGLRPGPALNPGEFDFADQAQRSRTLSLIRVRDWSGVTLLQPAAWWSPASVVEHLHQAAVSRLSEAVPEHQQPLVAALLLGRRESLPRSAIDRFAATGTIHILAISGLHVGLLAATLLGVLQGLAVPRRAAWSIVALSITLYAAVVGGQVPVVRATILLWSACLAVWLERRPAGLRSLALAAVGILLWSPATVVSVGTQLSFLATTVLLSVNHWLTPRHSKDPLERLIASARPKWQQQLRRLFGLLARLFLTSFAVWLASAPLVAASFHRVSPSAVLVNLLISPLVSVVLAAGLVCLLVGVLAPPLGWLAGGICGQAAGLLEATVTAVAEVPGSSLAVASPPGWWVAGWYLVLGGLLLSWHEAREGQPRLPGVSRSPQLQEGSGAAFRGRSGRFAVAAGCWGIVGLTVMLVPNMVGGSTRVVCAAMGHGCGIVVRTPTGRCLVYDAGRLGAATAAGRSISAVLQTEGVWAIDCLVLSHADTDHFNGVPALLRRFRVRQVVVPSAFLASRSATAGGLLEQLRQLRVPVRTAAAGDSIAIDAQCVARVLHPLPGLPLDGVSDNEQSLVLAVEAAGRRLLLTGDLEGESLSRFITAGPPACDLLVAPHHGSDGVGLGRLIQATRAEAVVVSGQGGHEWPPLIGCGLATQHKSPLVVRTAGSMKGDRGAVAAVLTKDGLEIAQFIDGRWQSLKVDKSQSITQCHPRLVPAEYAGQPTNDWIGQRNIVRTSNGADKIEGEQPAEQQQQRAADQTSYLPHGEVRDSDSGAEHRTRWHFAERRWAGIGLVEET